MNIALILSGGGGSRLGASIPKQYIQVENKAIISYCIETIIKSSIIDRIQIVADKKWHGKLLDCIRKVDASGKFHGFSAPGDNRQLSIWNGLEDIDKFAKINDIVFIHDAARPLLSEDMIEQIISAMQGHDGVIPVLPMKDTVYMSDDRECISALLDRRRVFAGQAPEAFLLGKYVEANRRLLPEKIKNIYGSTEPAIIAGMDIAMIPGDEHNFKITTQADLDRFCQIMQRKGTKEI